MIKTNTLKASEIAIFALGGLGEVGKNTYVIEYQNQIFIIDAGMLFPDEHLLGVDYVIPDYQYLIDNQDKIIGLFITHGHEDHIGGIPFMLKKVKIPKIYAAGVAVDLIENKLSEYEGLNPTIVEYKSNYKFKFNNVEISFIRMNHSIPDSFAICFKTPLGNILHTGDFKIDFTPIGPAAEYDKLAKIGAEGVLCLLADSTNAMLNGFTISESKVSSSIKEVFSKIDNRILVATFASNIYRIQQIVEASVINGRKIAIFGRSMEKTIELGQQIGYIRAPKNTFIDANEINNYPTNKITILCTGSQGEPLAALSRVAGGTHRQIKLIPGDTVIFSSSPIPGNSGGVNKTINMLFKKGANVIINSPLTDTHTSGHGASTELKLLQSLIKPKYFMPIHGEHRMLKTHADLAISVGVKKENAFVLDNGDVLFLSKEKAYVAGKVQSGDIYVDGSGIGDIGNVVIKERKLLSDDGLLSLIATINTKKLSLVISPTIVSRGFIYMKSNEEFTNNLIKASEELISQELAKMKTLNINLLKNQISELLSKLIYNYTERKPMILPVIMTI